MVQAACPQCANKIIVDDARAPERPFAVKCPKCQTTVRFPGRTAGAPGAAPAPAASAPPAPAPAPPPTETPRDEGRNAALAQHRREIAQKDAGHGRKVLVALADRSLAGALVQPLTRLGYTAEMLDTPDEGGRLLEDGVFDVVIATGTATVPGRQETLLQRVTRLAPAARRRIFLVLVGDAYKTGDGTQAFAAQADLVVNPRDAAAVESPLLSAMTERTRLYQPLLDARRLAGVD
ncbi:MAG TPA: MJ0042-type zinc finger domain-containing protein [Vicinamibacteria bacterium]|nr:MJ0042-type zinc finger domain-containing protein [Vicinamibacteria bacterium]